MISLKCMNANKHNKSNGHSNGNASQVVQIKFAHPTAMAVAIAGSFNNWRPDVTPMVSLVGPASQRV